MGFSPTAQVEMITSSSVSSEGNGYSSTNAYVCFALTVKARFDFVSFRGSCCVSGGSILSASCDFVVSGSDSKESTVLCGDLEGKSSVEGDWV